MRKIVWAPNKRNDQKYSNENLEALYDYAVKLLPDYTNQFYAQPTLCMCNVSPI